jgi:hypothetical protein
VMRANAGRGHIASAGEGVVVGACKRTALVASASEGALVGACAGTVRLRARARWWVRARAPSVCERGRGGECGGGPPPMGILACVARAPGQAAGSHRDRSSVW